MFDNNSQRLVSIIIPTYNRKKTIKDCLSSVLTQTYSNIEVIIVDDASNDGTQELLENISDNRLYYYCLNKNSGACFARNYGASMAHGYYIAFQDSDDIWMPDKISKQVAFLEKNKADFVFCGMYRIVNGYKFYEPLIDFENDKDSIEQLLVRNRASTQTMLMKKTITEKVSFDITFNRFQDWDFTLQVALNNYRLMYLKEPLAESMIRNDSISSNVNTNKALTHLYEKYKSYYKKYPHALAEYYISQARAYKNIDQKEAQRFLVKSFATKKNAKTLGRLLLNFVGLWDELGRNKLTYKKNGIGRNNKENRKNLNNVIIENTDSIDRGVILDKIYRQMKCFASEGRRIYA